MAECHERMLFRDLLDAKRHAEATGTLADYRAAARAYVCYIRSHLTDPEREVMQLEGEVARLCAEVRVLRDLLAHVSRTRTAPTKRGRGEAA